MKIQLVCLGPIGVLNDHVALSNLVYSNEDKRSEDTRPEHQKIGLRTQFNKAWHSF